MLVGPVNVSADLPPSRRFSSSASFWAYLSLSPTCSSLPCICSPPPPLTFLTLVLPSLPPWPSSVFSASWVMSCGYGWLHGFASHVVAQEPTLRKPPCLGFNAVQLLSWSSQNIFECVSCGWSLMGQQSISQRLGISVLYNLSFLCLPGKGFWSPSLRPFTALGPTFSPPPPLCLLYPCPDCFSSPDLDLSEGVRRVEVNLWHLGERPNRGGCPPYPTPHQCCQQHYSFSGPVG